MLFSCLQSTQKRNPPSFFGTNRTGYPAGDVEGLTCPFSRCFCRYSRTAKSSFSDIEYSGQYVGCFPSSRGISWSHGRCFGSADSTDFSMNNSSNSSYSDGSWGAAILVLTSGRIHMHFARFGSCLLIFLNFRDDIVHMTSFVVCWKLLSCS